MKYDRELAARFAAVAQEEGVYFHTLWHSGLSAMHTLEDVDEALERIERAARRVAAGAVVVDAARGRRPDLTDHHAPDCSRGNSPNVPVEDCDGSQRRGLLASATFRLARMPRCVDYGMH